MAHYAIYLGKPKGQQLLHPKYKKQICQPFATVDFHDEHLEFIGDEYKDKVWVDDALDNFYHELNQLLNDYEIATIKLNDAIIQQFLVETKHKNIEPWMEPRIKSLMRYTHDHPLHYLFEMVALARREGGTVILLGD